MKKIIIKLFTVFLYIFVSCAPCKPSEESEILYKKVKQKHEKYFELEYIPCEPWYINVITKGKIDTTALRSLQNDIYDKDKKIGWAVLLVMDKNRHYLFSYSSAQGVHIQSGD